MNVSIHQPNYLPWLGFFNKVAQSDIHVVFDDVQYPMGKDFHNRNQIKTNNGKTWLTIPVIGKSERRKFSEIQIKDNGWNKKHLNSIKNFYGKTKYFNEYYPSLEKFYTNTYDKLIDLNMDMNKWFFKLLDIDTKIIYSSELCELNKLFFQYNDLRGLDKIMYLLNKINTTRYITSNGPGASRYIDENVFKDNNIELIWNEYVHPTYNQQFKDFIPYMSILDLLFNEGPNSKNII
tara:strand:+ start:90 stop:794 length:705 start_codon:yes stop_codon:yes gene_type:complete